MSYKQEFGNNFDLGFKLNKHPLLIDKSWHNDICPSFYFKHISQYYVLWVDFLNPEDREGETFRYTIITATNEGDEKFPEIFTKDGDVIFETEIFEKVIKFIKTLIN